MKEKKKRFRNKKSKAAIKTSPIFQIKSKRWQSCRTFSKHIVKRDLKFSASNISYKEEDSVLKVLQCAVRVYACQSQSIYFIDVF
jgi:hypothetical protein